MSDWDTPEKRREREAATIAHEREQLLGKSTPRNLLIYLFSCAALWAPLLSFRVWKQLIPSGWSDLISVVVVLICFVAALLVTGIFGYVWLAIVTLRTPENYRGVVHFSCAVALASLYTFVDYDPVTALHHTIVYLDHNGFFALKIVALGVVVAAFAYKYSAGDYEVDEFPRYPLRWYGVLTFGSILVSFFLGPDAKSNAFHSYREIAYYTGAVIISYVSFFLGTHIGTQSR